MALLSGVVDPLYNPRIIPRAVKRGRALPTPVLWLDAAAGNFSNQGQAGNLLDAQNGSTGGVDTNDVQVLPHNGTNYLYLPGVAGNNVTVPDLAAYTPSTSLDVRVAVAMDAVSGTQAFIGHYTASATNRSWLFMYTGTNVTLYLSTDGTTASNFSPSVSPTITAGTVTLLRATWTASPAEVKFFQKSTTEGAAADDLVADTGWTQVGSTITASVPAVALANSTVPLAVGSQSGIDLLAGRVYRVQVRSGGTTVFDANFTSLTSGAATSFTESSANAATVTINRSTLGRKSTVVTRPTWLLGTDDYCQVADHPLLNFLANQDFHIVFAQRLWATNSDFRRFVSKSTDLSPTGQKGYEFRIFSTGTGIQGAVGDGSAAAAQWNFYPGFSPVLTNGAVQVIGMVRSGSANTCTFNNARVGNTSTANFDMSNTAPFRISGAMDEELFGAAVFRRPLDNAELFALNAYIGLAS
jgi:hypothetical protein